MGRLAFSIGFNSILGFTLDGYRELSCFIVLQKLMRYLPFVGDYMGIVWYATPSLFLLCNIVAQIVVIRCDLEED
jgi:hypothetical protein